MSNIEKIKAEIERLYDGEAPKHDQQCDFNDGYFMGIDVVSNFIDSLPECEETAKSPTEKYEEELNEEIQGFIDEYGYERGEDKILIAIVARHFAEWQKEQMMKDAVEAKIYGYDDGSFELIASWLDMPNNSIYKDGDKVKIIIVKEDD